MGEATNRPTRPSGRLRPGRRTVSAERLLRSAESAAFCLVIAPLVARMPARLAYRIACWRGDLTARYRAGKRAELVRNLSQVLGDELGSDEAERLAQEYFRMTSCEVIDVMRLRGQAQPLRKLVEIRGREHLDAALAAGKGAVLCTGHIGSFSCAISLLNACGYPVTAVGRTWWNYSAGKSSVERRLWDFVYARRLQRHRQRPNIEPFPGRLQVVMQAAIALRANEVVTVASDAPPLDADQARAVDMPFLGRQARLLPGVVGLAQLSRAPVFMMSMYRLPDYAHQVLEISPPVSMEGETATAFGRCTTAMEAAVRKSPAEWVYWASADDLSSLGLLPAAAPTETAGTPETAGTTADAQR